MQERAFEEHVAWSSSPMPECSPPMMPARPSGFFSSATSSRSGSSVQHLAVQQRELLAIARKAHDDVAVEQPVVVGVQRLAEFQHHVVGDVDEAEIERMPLRSRRCFIHAGVGACRVDALDHAADEARTGVGVLDAHVARSRSTSPASAATSGS